MKKEKGKESAPEKAAEEAWGQRWQKAGLTGETWKESLKTA